MSSSLRPLGHMPSRHLHVATRALSDSRDSQSIQSSKAAGSFVSQMARRRRRGESWRGALRGYLEMRKQKEQGGGRHMSALRDRKQGAAGKDGAMRCGRAGAGGQVRSGRVVRRGTRGRKWRLPRRRIWRCSPGLQLPGYTGYASSEDALAAGTRAGTQMQACSSCARMRRPGCGHKSQGFARRLALRNRYRPSSSNRFQLQCRFIQARHTAARAQIQN